MTTFATTIDATLLRKLDTTAAAAGRSRDDVIALALENYLDVTPDQIEHIKIGLAEADRGEFASDAEVEAVFAKLRRQAKRGSR